MPDPSKIVSYFPKKFLPALLGLLSSCHLHTPQNPPIWIGITLSAEDHPYLDSTCWKKAPQAYGLFLHLRLSYDRVRQAPEFRSSLRLQVLNYAEAFPDMPLALILDAPWDTMGFFPTPAALPYWIENLQHEVETTLFAYLPWDRVQYVFLGRDWLILRAAPEKWNALFHRWDSLYPYVRWGTVQSFPMPLSLPALEIIGINYIPHMPSATRQYHAAWDTLPSPLFITHANLYDVDKALAFRRRLSFWRRPIEGICLNSLDVIPVWCHPNPKIYFAP